MSCTSSNSRLPFLENCKVQKQVNIHVASPTGYKTLLFWTKEAVRTTNFSKESWRCKIFANPTSGHVTSSLSTTQVHRAYLVAPFKAKQSDLASQWAATVVLDLLLLLPIFPSCCQKITTWGERGTETLTFMIQKYLARSLPVQLLTVEK